MVRKSSFFPPSKEKNSFCCRTNYEFSLYQYVCVHWARGREGGRGREEFLAALLEYLDETKLAGSSPKSAGLALPSSAKCCSNQVNLLSSTSMYIWSAGSPLNSKKNCVRCMIETWHKYHNMIICFLWLSNIKCHDTGEWSIISVSSVAGSFVSSSNT